MARFPCRQPCSYYQWDVSKKVLVWLIQLCFGVFRVEVVAIGAIESLAGVSIEEFLKSPRRIGKSLNRRRMRLLKLE